MPRQYSFDDKNLIERTLCELFPPEWLREKAKETGLINRERKIDPVNMFWALAIGYGTFLQRTLAGLRRNYESASNMILSDSSWYYHFTPELVTFLRECVFGWLTSIREVMTDHGTQFHANKRNKNDYADSKFKNFLKK